MLLAEVLVPEEPIEAEKVHDALGDNAPVEYVHELSLANHASKLYNDKLGLCYGVFLLVVLTHQLYTV